MINLIHRVHRRLSPFHEIMPIHEYWRIKGLPPFEFGVGHIQGAPVDFSDKDGFLHSAREIFLEEVYKFSARTTEPLIVDAGANIGLSIIYFKRLYPRSRIIAYEPDPAIFKILSGNVSRLGLSHVDLRNSAAWVENTHLTFYSEGSLSGSTEIDFLSKGLATEVRAERLRETLEGGRVDFLKIDIEGAEDRVLFDIRDCLENVDHLFFEYHSQPGRDQALGDLLNLVRTAGFRYAINGAHCAHFPFLDHISRGFDLQLNISCFRF